MPRAKKKAAGNSKSAPAGEHSRDSFEPQIQTRRAFASSARSSQNKIGQRKRGWRDIEAISERARLKKMLVDIWHEDVEIDEDIFGDTDHLSGYYTESDDEVEEIEIDEDLLDEEEDFEEEED